jgi:hypothetical protein
VQDLALSLNTSLNAWGGSGAVICFEGLVAAVLWESRWAETWAVLYPADLWYVMPAGCVYR